MEECISIWDVTGTGYVTYESTLSLPLPGLFCEGSLTRFIVNAVIALFMSSIETEKGICDCLLWTHACTGLAGYVSPLALSLGIRGLLETPRLGWGDIYVDTPLRLFIVLVASFVTDVGLSYEASKMWTVLSTSGFMAVHVSLSYFLQHPDRSNSVSWVGSEASVGTEPLECSLIQTDPVIIERLQEPEPEPSSDNTPKQLSGEEDMVRTPGAVTTPTDVSRLGWTFDSGDERSESVPEWFYIDLSGGIRGPYGSDSMRMWHSSGFLKSDLLVSKDSPESGHFMPISELGPDPF